MSLNDFTIGKQLGKGAFGTVTIVTRKADGKVYAMKRINIGKLDNKEREASLNEIRILASLNHPNIIGYKEAFYDEPSKTINIVMEFADDGDIDHKIKENLKKRLYFDESTIWNWIIQILEGLKYLHDNKIMHRDLKCANIFLMKNGILKIGDLNVSKLAKNNMAQTQTGTPFYLAPEIWKDLPYDYKCDIWSVGCIIYELCTSRPPFRGTSMKDLMHNVMTGYYLPISNNYSSDIKQIISMMLVVDPKKRASTYDLLNCNIILNKIKNANSTIINKCVNSSNKQHANLIKTIKLPRNLHDINIVLPKKQYEEKMMENDPYETMKKTYMDTIKKEGSKNVPVNPAAPKIIINYGNKQQKYEGELHPIKEEPNKYNYMNKYFDNNMKPKVEVVQQKNNYNNNNYNNNNYNNNNYNNNNYNYNNNNNYNNNYNNNNYHNNQQQPKITPINNVPYRPSSQQQNVNNRFNNNINNNKSPKQQSSNNKKGNRYQNMFGNDDYGVTISNDNNKKQPPSKQRPSTNQQANRYQFDYNNNNNFNRYNNINNNRNRNYEEHQKGWFKRNYPGFKYEKPKAVQNSKINYGKVNYNDYCKKNNIDRNKNYHYYRENGYYNYNNAMKAYNGGNRYGFNANRPANNIYDAMGGVNNKNNKGPHIANIKKY